MTSSNIPVGKDKASTTGPIGRSPIYHIYRKVVTEEEWTQFHQKIVNQWKNEEKNEERNEEKNEEERRRENRRRNE